MKRLTGICLVLLYIGILMGLLKPAMDPTDFSGIWFSSENQSAYLFQEGLIIPSKQNTTLSDTDSICGAYVFCRDSVVLFVQDMEGLKTERELYLNQDGEVSFLSENSDGSGRIFFVRYKK